MNKIELIFILVIIFLIVTLIFQQYEIFKFRKKTEFMNKSKKMIYSVSEKISKAEKMQEVLDIMLDTAINFVNYACKGSILIVNEEGKFEFASLRGYSNNLRNVVLKKEELFLNDINNFKETAIIKNPTKFDNDILDSKKKKSFYDYEALDIYCTMCTPIHIDGKLIGILNVDIVNPEEKFADEDVELMNFIKNELEISLSNFIIKDKLTHMVQYDELTGLYNVRYFKEKLYDELNKIRKYNKQASLVLLDIDNFKRVNDIYGYSVGDKTLRNFSNILRENISNLDLYARFSGDKFAILFVDCNMNNAINKLQHIRGIFDENYIYSINLSFSYGICEFDSDEKFTVDYILGKADSEIHLNKKHKNSKV